jgi:hypothetical protein
MNLPFKLFIALVHHPVVNKFGELITTSVTNLDLHDISRSAKTFGAEKYYVVTPIEEQQNLVRDVMGHWKTGGGREFNPIRADALERLEIISSIDEMLSEIKEISGKEPLLGVTSARFEGEGLSSASKFYELASERGAGLILFGTGYGLAEDVVQASDVKIEPILGLDPQDNHLSVRSAVAITLDRLLNGR